MSSPTTAGEIRLVPGGSKVTKGTKTETTLGEHGRGLLIGAINDSKVSRTSYRFCPIDLPYRVMIGTEIDNNIDLRGRVGERLMRALALSLTSFGGDGWGAKTLAAKVEELGRTLTVGDIQYMAFVRLAEESPDGWKRPMPFDKCPYCKAEMPPQVTVDLKDVYCIAWDKLPEAEYMLEHPWHFAGQLVKTVTMTAPSLVRAMMPMADDDNDLTRKLLWMASSIKAVNGAPATLHWKQLFERDPTTGRGMHNEDFDRMELLMNSLAGGPAIAVTWTHDVASCGKPVPIPITWNDAFFVRSGA